MKAIKLASVFAVSAVAAAVSSTTFASAPAGDALVITGEAGVEYINYHGSKSDTNGDTADGTDLGEIEFHVDNGIIYAELEVKTTGEDEETDVNMEKLYVKQGAVSFGRFDGTVATGSFMGIDEIFGGVDLVDGRVTNEDTDNTGIRYKATPELTLSVEATGSANADADKGTYKIDSEIGVAFSYVKDFGVVKAGISAGSVGDANAYNIGVQSTIGMATISANYGAGEKASSNSTASKTVTEDLEQAQVNIILAVTDALTLTYEYAVDLELSDKAGENRTVDGTYFIAEYAVGDLTYYFKTYNGDGAKADLDNSDFGKNIVGVKAFF